MTSIPIKNFSINNIKPVAEALRNPELDKMVEHSKILMAEYGTLFKSKTLEKLYTPQFRYKGLLPRTTYIIDKKTGKKKLIYITRSTGCSYHSGIEERYTAKTFGGKNLGKKSFETIDTNGKPGLDTGVMKSKANNRYAGTQIRLTQIEVERAMQMNEDSIPLISVAEALPFHTMMGFRPNEECLIEIKNANVAHAMTNRLIDACADVNPKHFTPIVHYKDGKYYFDENQTVANATLRHFKEEADGGKTRNFHSIFVADSVEMNLSGKELEAWKQRALSQPILLKKSGKKI